MAHNSIKHLFDIEDASASVHYTRRPSGSSQRYARTAVPQDNGRVLDLPLPTVSQLRRGSRGTIQRRRSTLAENQPVADQELTEQELYNLLQQHNNTLATNQNATIRLPSDILYRRKSRFVESDEHDSIGELNITSLAMAAARTREEGDPVKKSYKKLRSFYQETTLLKTTLNRIQGRYGAAIMEYFSFVKWLVILNIIITVLSLPMILPQFVLQPFSYNDSIPEFHRSLNLDLSCYRMQAEECSTNYGTIVEDSSFHNMSEIYLYLLDFIQGTGFLEQTELFYGAYNRMKWDTGTYPMPIAFLVTTFLSLFTSLVWILYSISSHMQSTVVATGDSTAAQNISIAVLSGWDHGLMGRSAAKIKKELIKQDLNRMLREEEFKKLIDKRTRCQKYGLWAVRVVVNLVVLGIQFGCGYAIFRTSEMAERDKNQFTEYAPAVVITAIYLVVPTFFNIIARLERYKPAVELGITMARILFLRLASLFLLLITTFDKLDGVEDVKTFNDTSVGESCGHQTPLCGNPLFTDGKTSLHKCWETYIGQQIYRLIILDFAVLLATTYLVEYPRQAIYKRFQKTPFMTWLGQQEFDMPKNVMDVLYNQILCWIGMFFAPFVPLMITLKMVLFFIIKRGTLFANLRPSATLSKSSALSSFFYLVMWVSLVLAYLVLVVFMQFVKPSQSCGPFRIYTDSNYTMFAVITKTLPETAKDIVFVLENRLLQVAIIIVLLILWYLFVTVSNGLTGEAKQYVKQLTKSIKDKQYLLAQVNQAIKETNDTTISNPRPSTSNDPLSREPDVNIASPSKTQAFIDAACTDTHTYYSYHQDISQQQNTPFDDSKTKVVKREFIERKTKAFETHSVPLSNRSSSSSSDSEGYEGPTNIHRDNSRRIAYSEQFVNVDPEDYMDMTKHGNGSGGARRSQIVRQERISRKYKHDERLLGQVSDSHGGADAEPIDERHSHQYENAAFEPEPDY